MTWILTATGQQVDLALIANETISVVDIAHHLAQINRFTGACQRPMSVAEHSLFVLAIIEAKAPEIVEPSILLAALMHDAHEAYTNDISQPMKQVLGDGWHLTERRIQQRVLARFGLAEAFAGASRLIHWADMVALHTERLHLMPARGPEWPVERTHDATRCWNFVDNAAFTWRDWRELFLERYGELDFARKQPREVKP
jgi:hypothetical protein